MTLNLQQTVIDPINDPDMSNKAALQAALKDTQGNILRSHGRNNSQHLFIEFTGTSDAVRSWLAKMATDHVTSAWTQMEASVEFAASGVNGGVFANLCLSATGYNALGADVATPDDSSFTGGAKNAVGRLADPPVDEWEEGFQGRIDALIIVADDVAIDLAVAVARISQSLDGVGTIVHEETGAAMRVEAGKVSTDKSARVHEHFGFADGVSQPLFFAKDVEASRRISGGFDEWDPSAPLGLVLAKDPNGGPDGYGTYMVYRKLEQNVAGFRDDEAKLAEKLSDSSTPSDEQKELAAAYIVGRFRDGTPVSEQSVSGATNEPNNFNYNHDVDGVKCPFHAHARKTNPRGDKGQQFLIPLQQERSRRIVRRAISYGPLTLDPMPDEKVGLLFLCAQSSIPHQFEFMQAAWCDFNDFLRPDTGIDPVIGQVPNRQPTVAQKWPRVYGSFNGLDFSSGRPETVSPYIEYKFSEWVTMRGGEYFFVPSLSFLAGGSEELR